MNNKTNKWAVLVSTPALNEAVQRIAFSFGYEWHGRGKSLSNNIENVLYFNPIDKKITFGMDSKEIELYACKVCNTLEQVMETFANPPNNQKRVLEIATLHKDGSVDLIGTVLSSSKFDELVKIRNEFLGQKEVKVNKNRRLPKVGFIYSGSSSGKRNRRVMIVEDLGDTYACLDMDDGNAFKQFRKDRILGSIWFIGLSEEKEW